MRRKEMSFNYRHTGKKEQQRLGESLSGTKTELAEMGKLDDLTKASEHKVKLRTLLVISAQPSPTMQAEVAAGQQPRRDYSALQQALDADVLYADDVQTSRLDRLIKQFLGPKAASVRAAFRRRYTYDIIYSDTEAIGLPLALLLKLSTTRAAHPRHVMLAHYLSPFKKRIWFKFGVGSHINTLIVHSSAQCVKATDVLHIPKEQVVQLPYQVDERFWHPLPLSAIDDNIVKIAEECPIICVPGMECRDYATLLTAVRGLKVKVHISTRFVTPQQAALASSPDLPSNISFEKYNYVMLRQIYAVARFVIVPLLEVDFQAGITVILEAMAMGKAVIVSGIRGQTDVVRDLRNHGRGLVVREWWPGFLRAPGVAEALGHLSTGLYVKPGDPDDMRDTIQYLLNHPEVAEELGRNGRHVAEAYFGLDAFARRFAAAILGEPLPAD